MAAGPEPASGGIKCGTATLASDSRDAVPLATVRLDAYWSFTSLQHLRTYRDGCRLVTVRAYGNFIVLLHWKLRLMAP